MTPDADYVHFDYPTGPSKQVYLYTYGRDEAPHLYMGVRNSAGAWPNQVRLHERFKDDPEVQKWLEATFPNRVVYFFGGAG